MKAMPLPFEDFQGKGVKLDFSYSTATTPSSSSSSSLLLDSLSPHPPHQQLLQQKWQSNSKDNCCFYVGSTTEPTSVLDARRSPSSPTSSTSKLSSSQGGVTGAGGGGGGASTDTTTTTGVAAAASGNNNNNNPSVDIVSAEKCGGQLGMEDWESVLSGSPSQEPSILRLILGDVEDPSLGLNKLLQTGGTGSQDMDQFNAGFGVVDPGFGFEPLTSGAGVVNSIDPPFHGTAASSTSSDFPLLTHSSNARIGPVMNQNPNSGLMFTTTASNLLPGMFHHQHQQEQQGIEASEEKPQILNPQVIINQNQHQFAQNPPMFLPLSYGQLQEHHLLSSPPPPKRLNSGPVGANYHQVARPEFFLQRQQQQQQQQQHQLQMLQQQQRPAAAAAAAAMMMKQKLATDELGNQQQLQLHQQAIINPICQAAELIETGNPVLAQGILARLNQQLSLPIGKPYHRAAFYFKEALQLLLHNTTPNNSSPCSLIFKIGAYKSFSEISPIIQFANFTCNQVLLEAFEGFDRIHIFDFEIGYGGQWASLMQELALRNGGAPSLKISAFASSSTHDELELGFTQENLRIFAREISMPLELEILNLESLNSGSWPMPLRVSEKEVVAVNLPIGSFSNNPSFLPVVLRFVKQLSPKIVVSLDRGCDRCDLSFAHHVNHAIQSYLSLLESLDAVNVNLDALQKIERFLIQPAIEKIVLGRRRCPDRTPPWRNLFVQSGFTPLTFSNFTESQAECLVQRTPAKGFHVEKRQSSLVLCWQRKELISASAWRC